MYRCEQSPHLGYHVDGILCFSYGCFVFVFCEVRFEFICWFMRYVNIEWSE